ncbi:MAG: hypothetical protein JST89_13740 [Cyanobacteria bacterium SZAS-4]|nr:hypothetical protein [Cyanobacteria bacterium SZAS-4]
MSRILEDNDAKAMIVAVALLIGIPVLVGLVMPKPTGTGANSELHSRYEAK